MNDICGESITINGQTYSCDIAAGHEGNHVCGVKTGENNYDGFEFGPGLIYIPPSVAAALFDYTGHFAEAVYQETLQTRKEIEQYARDTLVRLRFELETYVDRINNSIRELEKID